MGRKKGAAVCAPFGGAESPSNTRVWTKVYLQDEAWDAGRPRPWPHYVRWEPSSPSPKRETAPIFGSYLLWPNCWMDQDATWYGSRPQPRPHCARWGSSSPPQKKGGTAPQLSAHVCCGQTAGCIKMPLGWEVPVDLGPGHIVLDGDPAPTFWPC